VRVHPKVTHNVVTWKKISKVTLLKKMFKVQGQIKQCRELPKNSRLCLKSRSDQGLSISEGEIVGPLWVFLEKNAKFRFHQKLTILLKRHTSDFRQSARHRCDIGCLPVGMGLGTSPSSPVTGKIKTIVGPHNTVKPLNDGKLSSHEKIPSLRGFRL